MKIEKITHKLKAASLAGLMLLSGWNGKAEETPKQTGLSGRAKIEFSEKGDDTRRVVSTFALDKAGAYSKLPSSLGAQFSENFRSYQVDEFSPKGDIHYNAFGVATPILKLSGTETKAIAGANLGDRQGILGETSTMISKEFGVGIAGERSETLDFTRLGGQVIFNLKPFDFTIGYEIKNTSGREMSQVFARGIWDINGKDYVGLGSATRAQGDYKQQYLGGLYLHGGKDAKFGLRSFGQAFFDNRNCVNALGQILFTPGKTSLGIGGARMLLGNSALESGYGPYLGDSELLVTRSPKESIPLYFRPALGQEGVAFGANMKYNQNKNKSSGYAGAGAAFTVYSRKWMFGASTDINYNFLENRKNYTSICPGLYARKLDGKLEAYLNVSIPVDEKPMPGFTVAVQRSF